MIYYKIDNLNAHAYKYHILSTIICSIQLSLLLLHMRNIMNCNKKELDKFKKIEFNWVHIHVIGSLMMALTCKYNQIWLEFKTMPICNVTVTLSQSLWMIHSSDSSIS